MKATYIEASDSKSNQGIFVQNKRKKVAPEIAKRAELFDTQLGLGTIEETEEEYIERLETAHGKPQIHKVLESYEDKFYISIEPNKDDIIEVALFKAAMYQDQETFAALVVNDEINPKVKEHVLSSCVLIACFFQDIEVVKFLIKNEVEIINLISIDDEDASLSLVSPILSALSGLSKKAHYMTIFKKGT
jgi:hypothetical protein